MVASSQTITLLHDFVLEETASSASNLPPPTASSGQNSHKTGEPYGEDGFDANVVMVLAVLLCALVSSLGLNSIVRCALRCSHLVATQSASTALLANTGMKRKSIKTIPIVNYSDGLNLQHLDTECLSEFAEGERVRVLPKCNHGFHVCCIDKWLTSHSSCPTCRYSLMDTSQKKTSCSQSISSGTVQSPPAPVPQETIVSIAPLNPEPIVPNYRVI